MQPNGWLVVLVTKDMNNNQATDIDTQTQFYKMWVHIFW